MRENEKHARITFFGPILQGNENHIQVGNMREEACEQILKDNWPQCEIIESKSGIHGIDFVVFVPDTLFGNILAIVEVKGDKGSLSQKQMTDDWVINHLKSNPDLMTLAKSVSHIFKYVMKVSFDKKTGFWKARAGNKTGESIHIDFEKET